MRRFRLLAPLHCHLAHLALALLLGLFGVIADLLPPVSALEERVGLAWLFHWRGAVPAPKQVVVIALDQESTRALGLPPKPDQWPRAMHARLIRQLTLAGASVIVFDLLFNNASTYALQDEALAAAMRAARNVVLTESLVQDQVVISAANGQQVSAASIEKTMLPIPLLTQAAIGTAPFPLPKNMRVDATWLFKSGAGSIPMLPTLALQLYALDGLDGLNTYDALRRLLQKEDALFTATLPANRDAILQQGALEKLALQLRHYVVSHPAHGRRLLQAVASDMAIDPQHKATLRSLIRMYMGPEARYLNFYGPHHSITTIPYYQALHYQALNNQGLNNQPLAMTMFRDKVVFIGYSAATTSGQDRIRDDYDTVFSRDDGLQLSGVEIGATAFANALDARFVEPLNALERLGLLLAWGYLLALISLHKSVSRAATLILLSICLYLTIALQLFVQGSIWLPLITPLLVQLPLAVFGTTLLRYLMAKKERVHLQAVFSHFIPPSMVEKLAAHAPALGEVDRVFYGVCLATDASNYTGLAETMEPIALTNLMNRYYAALFAPVAIHGGIVSDIKGDAMMAIWSGDHEDATMRMQACRAAWDIHAAMVQAAHSVGHAMLPTRIGLECGALTVGNVGAGQHYEYRAVGDTVNTASRIEGLNKPLGTCLLASAAVVDGIASGDGFLLRALGSFLLAGKSIPIKVVEILCGPGVHDFYDEKLNLCSRFGDALVLFQQQRWQQAEAAFTAVLHTYPKDGPSMFYVQECVRKRTANGPDNDNAVIRITGK